MNLVEYKSSTHTHLAAMVWPGTRTRAVVLVHGLASNARTWTQVAGLLNGFGAHVIAYDQRSHGLSQQVRDGFDFATYVADLEAVIVQSDVDRPITVGQSWGGNVVVEHGSVHTTAGVVAVDGGFINLKNRWPDWRDCAATLAPPRLSGVTRSAIEAYMQTSHPDWPQQSIGDALANFDHHDDGTVRPHLGFDEHMAILRSLWDHDPRSAIAKIFAPTLAVAARPSLTPVAEVEDAGFDRVVWIDGDHDLHLQQPGVIADLIWEATGWDQ